MTQAAVERVADWREALNPPIYLVSILPGLGVWWLARGDVQFTLGLLLATLAVVLVQHAINLYNDAADWRLGADTEKYDSWVRVHDQRPSVAVVHGTVALLVGGLLGIVVLWLQDQLWLMVAALPMVGLGYLYNAGVKPLSYTHLGEWVTGLCYGPGVFGCLWLVAGRPVDASWIAGSLAFAALAVALLLSHQPPQIETDRRAGKYTFAVRYGVRATRLTARALFAVFLTTMLAGAASRDDSVVWWLHVAVAAILMAYVALAGVNPKTILLSASVFVLSGLAAMHLGTV